MSGVDYSSERARRDLRTIHSTHPELSDELQAFIDRLENKVMVLSNDDAFRAYLMAKAQQDGAVLALLQKLDSSLITSLVKAEADKVKVTLIEAEERAGRAMTLSGILTEPVVLSAITVVSSVMTGVITLILHLAGA